MIKTISFFAFFFAGFASLAGIALFLLINKMKSGQLRKEEPLLCLVITAAVMGIFYLAEFYYFDRNASDSGWRGLERMVDMLLYMLIAFFWFRFLPRDRWPDYWPYDSDSACLWLPDGRALHCFS